MRDAVCLLISPSTYSERAWVKRLIIILPIKRTIFHFRRRYAPKRLPQRNYRNSFRHTPLRDWSFHLMPDILFPRCFALLSARLPFISSIRIFKEARNIKNSRYIDAPQKSPTKMRANDEEFLRNGVRRVTGSIMSLSYLENSHRDNANLVGRIIISRPVRDTRATLKKRRG